LRVAIVGYGVEGRAAERYWSRLGWEVIVHDSRADVRSPADVTAMIGKDYLREFIGVDLIVRSPSVRPDQLPANIPTTSVTREFFNKCHATIIGVTGTKGKGTTCSVIMSILSAAGKTALFGGNVGRPPLDFLPTLARDHLVVLELSNFQLMDMTASPEVAVVLALTPDHLNWHSDVAEYFSVKGSIIRYQESTDMVLFDSTNQESASMAAGSAGRKIGIGNEEGVYIADSSIYYAGRQIIGLNEIPLAGRHNVWNVCAAVGATFDLVAGNVEMLRRGTRASNPLPHRLAVVGTYNERLFVDDSCSTTPEAAIAALDAFEGPKVVIMGGSSKGADFGQLADAVRRSNVRYVLLVGVEGATIGEALSARGFVDFQRQPGSMADIVEEARRISRPGDVVLLSPACASYGDYVDYSERGEKFADAVERLATL
jgi:UDP-N-acetylmuramoylalanine--D-glutamate ligase